MSGGTGDDILNYEEKMPYCYSTNTKEPDEELSLYENKSPHSDVWRRKDKKQLPKWRR